MLAERFKSAQDTFVMKMMLLEEHNLLRPARMEREENALEEREGHIRNANSSCWEHLNRFGELPAQVILSVKGKGGKSQ